MSGQVNPFHYGRPLRDAGGLVGREVELEELLGCVRSGQAAMVYGPRRYGKTSLARVVEGRACEEFGIEGIYVDPWGAASISDIVGVLGRAYDRVSGAFRMRRFLADLLGRLGFSVSFEGAAVGISYEGAQKEKREREALMELLRVPQRMSPRATSGRVLVILDEFGEVLNAPGEPDALMRSAFQDSPEVSFLFIGSKKSLMDGLFSDRHRPFYNFGRRIELRRLPYEDLGSFIEERFDAAGKLISPEATDVLLGLSQGHPYRIQQLASHTFRLLQALRGRGGRGDGPRCQRRHPRRDGAGNSIRWIPGRISTSLPPPRHPIVSPTSPPVRCDMPTSSSPSPGLARQPPDSGA